MTSLERGAYNPKMEKLPSLDLDDDEPAPEEGARLPLLIAVALVVLAAFAGVVWLAYTQGVQRGRAEEPQIVAQSAVHKTNAATQSPPFTGLNIYQPAVTRNGHSGAGKVAGPVHAAIPPPSLRPTANGGPETFAAGTEPAHPFVTPTVPPAPPPAAAKPATQTAKASTSAPAGAQPAATAPSTPTQSSGVLIQVGSYKSEAEAQQSWLAFKARHEAAAGYQSDIKEVDLGGKGVWYRLRIGPFDDKDSAADVCAKLRADGASCINPK
jgi:cell division septation protein DedD